jgi:hypothetical protein
MSKTYHMAVFRIDVGHSGGDEDDKIVLSLSGTVRPSTKKALQAAIAAGNVTIREDKGVLA